MIKQSSTVQYHIMFVHDCLLVCKISTVRIVALKEKLTQFKLSRK